MSYIRKLIVYSRSEFMAEKEKVLLERLEVSNQKLESLEEVLLEKMKCLEVSTESNGRLFFYCNRNTSMISS